MRKFYTTCFHKTLNCISMLKHGDFYNNMKKDKIVEERVKLGAERSLMEANERKKNAKKTTNSKELGGRDGPDPTRYGDWEKKGIAIDF